MAKTLKAGLYIRVSRVNDRDDTTGYHSPEEQEEKTRARAELDGYQVTRVVPEENVSGGKAATERRLDELIVLCEQGKINAIYVYSFDRFTREHPYDAPVALARLRDANAKMISVLEGFDSSSSMGIITAGLLASMAWGYRERLKESWSTSIRRAVDDGIWPFPKVPLGYVRNAETRTLEIDQDAAHLAREMFEMKARKVSRRKIALWLTEQGYPVSEAAIANRIANPCYLGEVRITDTATREVKFSKLNAHPALVSRKLWDEANAVKGKKSVGDGSLTAAALLPGLVRCGNCGNLVAIGGTKTKAGRVHHYACRNSVHCGDGRAYARGPILDNYVEEKMLAYWRELVPAVIRTVGQETTRPTVALKEYEDAEYAVENWTQASRLISSLGEDAYVQRMNELVTIRNMAKAELLEAQAEVDTPDLLENVAEVWNEWSIQSRAEYLSRVIESIVIHRGKEDISERCEIKMSKAKGKYLKVWGVDRDHWAAEGIRSATS